MNYNENIQPKKHTQAEIARKRYGRDVLAIVGVTVALVGIGFAGRNSNKTPEKTKEYMVQRGDTEWGIAEKTWPNSDPRKHLAYIDSQLPNDTGIEGGQLQSGDKIQLPADAPEFNKTDLHSNQG